LKNKIFKYQNALSKFPNCPSDDYMEIDKDSYRWISKNKVKGNFIPRNLIKEPPSRMLDDTDKMCMGYGLSFFDSLENALKTFVKLYLKQREKLRSGFILDYGDSIALIKIKAQDGVAGNFNLKTGHFTFHLYENVNFDNNISKFLDIFDKDGEINNHTE